MAVINEKLRIQGMGCGHCIAAVRQALDSVEGVSVRKVEIGTAEIGFDDERVAESRIEEAVRAAGYQPVSHERV